MIGEILVGVGAERGHQAWVLGVGVGVEAGRERDRGRVRGRGSGRERVLHTFIFEKTRNTP